MVTSRTRSITVGAAMLAALALGAAACGSDSGLRTAAGDDRSNESPSPSGPGTPSASPSPPPTEPSLPGSPSPSNPASPIPPPSGVPTLPIPPPEHGGEVTLEGTVQPGVEAGCRVLMSDDRRVYLLIGEPEDGETIPLDTRVRVRGELSDQIVSFCQQGIPLTVIDVAPVR